MGHTKGPFMGLWAGSLLAGLADHFFIAQVKFVGGLLKSFHSEAQLLIITLLAIYHFLTEKVPLSYML